MSANYDKFMVVLPTLMMRQKDVVLDYYDELRTRIRELEAALREVWSDPDVPGQFDEATIARVDALLPPSETKGEQG